MNKLPRLLLIPCLLLAFSSVAPASNGHGTPDGQPPADEVVCSGFSGSAFGLCNAYCEAMDCDSGTPHASQAACDNVRNNFMRKTGSDLPCLFSQGS